MNAVDLPAKIRTTHKLCDLSQAMRRLAAARRGQAVQLFSGLERYAEATRQALKQGLALWKSETVAATGPRLVVACLSEHGFVGSQNEMLLQTLVAVRAEKPAQVLLLGHRGRRYVTERGVPVDHFLNMPTTLSSVSQVAQELLQFLFQRIERQQIQEVKVVFARPMGPACFEPHAESLFPPPVQASEKTQRPPVHSMPARELTALLIKEYVYAQVMWMIASAFAAEQAARFSAMDASVRKLQEQLSELRLLEQMERQDTITNEILEVAAATSLLLSSAAPVDGGDKTGGVAKPASVPNARAHR